MGWVDESGAGQIHDGTLLIRVDGDPRVAVAASRSWRPATLAACEVLLTGCPGTVAAVVDRTSLSMSTASTALKFLELQGLLESRAARGPAARRTVADKIELANAYAVAAIRLRSPVLARVGVLWRDPVAGMVEAGRAWCDAGVDWAVTSALSAAILAPKLTEPSPLEVYVTGRSRAELRWAAGLAGLEAREAGRLVLRPFPTSAGVAVSSEVAPGLQSVLWPRAFADLRAAGVRGEDAADHLMAEMSRG